jgi:hypothetical protein
MVVNYPPQPTAAAMPPQLPGALSVQPQARLAPLLDPNTAPPQPRRVGPAAGNPPGTPKKSEAAGCDSYLVEEEVSHMLLFFTLQVRAQCHSILGCGAEFDAELARIDPEHGGRDVIALEYAMEQFFAFKARDDKWVPWHTVLGMHERYIQEKLHAGLPHLTVEEKYLLHFVFRSTSWIPLFDAIVLPLFCAPGADVLDSEAHRTWKALLWNPVEAYRRGGALQLSFDRYRAIPGNKLHTTSYLCRPPLGASGDAFTRYIIGKLLHRARVLLRSARSQPTHRAIHEIQLLYPHRAHGGVPADGKAGLAAGQARDSAHLGPARRMLPTDQEHR